MKYTAHIFWAVIFLTHSLPALAKAQWPRGENNTYLQFSFGGAVADNQFDSTRNLQSLALATGDDRYSEGAFYAYLEQGLSKKFTFIGSTFYKNITIQNAAGDFGTAGLSDLTLSLRYTAVNTGLLVISPQLGLKIPTGYDADTNPPLGSGEADLLASVASGLSFYPVPAYVGIRVGARVRGGTQQDEFFGHIEGGYFIQPHFLIRSRLDATESTTNTNNQFNVATQTNEQGFVTLGPGLTASITDNIDLSFDGRWTIDGRTTTNLTTFLGGIAFTW